MELDRTLVMGGRACPIMVAAGAMMDARARAAHASSCPHCLELLAQGTEPTAAAPPIETTQPGPRHARGTALARGTLIGRYRIDHQLGEGGMGVVYRAIDTELDRPVALKLVHPDARAIEEITDRLRHESRLQARVTHPSVITVHDIGRDGQVVYVAMELAHGGTLRSWLAAPGTRSVREVIDVVRRAGEGLAAAHAAGLVHCDFKPENVLVEEPAGRATRVLVIDFGVARALEVAERSSGIFVDGVDLTSTGALVGTPAYMAPEQLAAAPVDARTDVFAFGVVLWEALYGQRPFLGSSLGELVVAMAAPPVTPTGRHVRDRVPRWLDRVLRRALALEPSARYQSMADVLGALDGRDRRRTRRIGAALAGMVVIAGSAIALAQLGGGDEPALVPSACGSDPGAAQALDAAAQQVRALPASAPHERWAAQLARHARDVALTRAQLCGGLPRPANWADRLRCVELAGLQAAKRSEVIVHRLEAGAAEARRFEPALPGECLGDRAAAVAAVFPDDANRTAVVEARIDLEALHDVAPRDRARALDAIAERARHFHHPAFAHELAFARAELTLSPNAAYDGMREVATSADRAGVYWVAAAAWLAIADKMVVSGYDVHRARELMAQADAALVRAGDPIAYRGKWHALGAYFFALAGDEAGMAREVRAIDELLAGKPFEPDVTLWLARAHLRAGHFEQALALAKRAIDITRPSDAGDFAQWARRTYAGTLLGVSRPDEAKAILLPMVARLTPPLEPDADAQILLLSSVHNMLGEYDQTLALAATWSAPIEQLLGPHSYAVGRIRLAQAIAAFSSKRYAEAERMSTEALEIHASQVGADTYDTADVRVLHGQILVALGRIDAGREALERGVKDLIAASSESDPLVMQGKLALADALQRSGRPAEALALVDKQLGPYKQLGTAPEELAAAEMTAARSLVALHRDRPRARAIVQRAIAVWSKHPADWKRELAGARALARRLR